MFQFAGCKLEFDGSIKSKVVLGEKVADEQETKKRNSKKKKKNKERNVSDDGKEKAGKDNKMQGKLPGGKNGSESVVDQGGSGGKAAGGTASAGETGTVEGMEAGGMPEDDSNETDNPAWDIEEKNGETSMDADQSDSAEGKFNACVYPGFTWLEISHHYIPIHFTIKWLHWIAVVGKWLQVSYLATQMCDSPSMIYKMFRHRCGQQMCSSFNMALFNKYRRNLC